MENLNKKREQIIKDLECCVTPFEGDCKKCSYNGKGFDDGVYEGCVNCLVRDALSLIKAQAVDYTELDEKYRNLLWENERLHTSCTELAQKCASLTEENERLTKRLEKEAKCQYDLCGQIVDLKAENEWLITERGAAVDDLRDCMYYAKPKRANTCNFCIHDCEVSQDGTQCKGKDNLIYCSPVWRGVVKSKSEGE